MALYRQGLSSFMSEVTHDGVGIGGGFIAGGVVGRQVENLVMKNPVTETSPLGEKVIAAVANNGAKAALYILMKTYDAGSPLTRKAAESLAGSVVYDLVLRAANKGVNPADVSIGGYRILGDQGMNPATIQKLVQENGILRSELNKALQRLAYNPDKPGFRNAAFVSPAVAERQRKYGAMPFSAPDPLERQRRFGAMPYEQNPDKTRRERKFGFMSDPMVTSASAESFGMQ